METRELVKLPAGLAGVVWDFDGTLFNSFGLQETVLSEVLKRRGMPIPSHELFVKNYHARLIDTFRELGQIEGDLLKEIYEDFIHSEEHHYEDPSGLFYADALNLLSSSCSAGLKNIIISNRPHFSDSRLGSPRNLSKRQPLKGLVDAVVCGDDSELFHKPDARTLDAIEQELGLSRKELVVIGDQFVDAELANNLGVRAILISREGKPIPHLERLHDGWEAKVAVVRDLNQVVV